jgi:signal transduction histidine kinase
MASVPWSILNPDTRPESIGRRIARWSRFTGDCGVESENTLTGLIALVALPAAFAVSLAFSLPLALPLALATINLSIAGERRIAAKRARVAELFLAILLALVAVFFTVLALSGAAKLAALAGVMLSLAFAGLPSILRLLKTENLDTGSAHCRDVKGLDRLMPDERLVIVARNGRIAALSRAVIRQFAASGVKPGTDIHRLIDILDRPLLLNALDKAGQQEQVISLRLNAEHCPRGQGSPRIDLSLVASNAETVIVRLLDSPPCIPDNMQPDRDRLERTDCAADPQSETIAEERACDLEEAVRFAIRLLASDADKQGVRVTMTGRPDREAETALLVGCSARVARQIALNIIGNAIKFSHAGGHVTIEADVDGQDAQLCIRDQGIGIAERDRDALFCPHKRGGGRDRPGSGLGLAIVGDLVAGCDGRISVKSAPGKGTTVTIRLPAHGLDHQAGRIDPHRIGKQTPEIARAA